MRLYLFIIKYMFDQYFICKPPYLTNKKQIKMPYFNYKSKMLKKATIPVIFAFLMSALNAQVTDTANVTIPGTLDSIAKAYLTKVKNLTVTGTIDARDFKTMRDSMPVLAVIDISGATIAPYNGTEGTQDSNTDTYPANAIPQYAFYNNHTKTSKTSLISIKLPNNIISIRDSAFFDCSGLICSLNIPFSVTYIGTMAFAGCYRLADSLTISSSVTYIGDRAFTFCDGLKGFSVNAGNPDYCSVNGVLFNKSKRMLIQCPGGISGTYTIPSTVDTIGIGAFAGCYGLKGTLNIPSSVSYIGDWAFAYCTGFTGNLTIPASVITIGNYAFNACSSFTGPLSIPSSVNYIGEQAFGGCYSLNGPLTIPSSVTYIGSVAFTNDTGFTGTLTIPSSVAYIGEFAFSGCTGLKSIVSLNPMPLTGNSIGNSVFFTNNIKNLYVPFSSVNLYNDALQWNSFNILPVIKVSCGSDSVLTGNSVTFSADTGCIGNPVKLQWQVNGANEGTGNNSFSYVPQNGDSVNCKVIFDNDSVNSDAIVIKAVQSTLSVSATELNISDTTKIVKSLTIYSNTAWNIKTSDAWITTNVNHGTDTANIILTITTNNFGLPRTDTIIVSAVGVGSQTIIVLQEANTETNVRAADNAEVKLYPVPVNNILNVYLPFTPDNTKIFIYKADGVEVYSAKLTDSKTGIDMGNFSPGIYLIKITSPDNDILIKKILKL